MEMFSVNGKPYQSRLIPYVKEIIALRRKRPPMSYSQIAALLNEKYQLTIHRSSIFDFIKRRVSKEVKPCKYDAWDIELPEANNQQDTKIKAMEKPAISEPPVTDSPKPPEEKKELVLPKLSDFGWVDITKPYKERMSPEDKAILLKMVEEKERKNIEKLTASEPPVTDAPKTLADYMNKPFEMKFSERYNLHRLPPEIADAWRKKIEEEERERDGRK
jgi:hypothetical protein